MWEIIIFLKEKLKGYKFSYLIRLEIESFFIYFSSLIPTKIGMVIRCVILKLFLKKSKGFQWIAPNVIFEHTKKISIGKNVGINSNTYINGVGEIEIGNNVLMGTSITITSGSHPIDNKKIPIFYRQVIPKKIIIEDDVWIGSNVCIMPGVKIRRGSVIGANSVVKTDSQLEEYTIYAGAPVRKIGIR